MMEYSTVFAVLFCKLRPHNHGTLVSGYFRPSWGQIIHYAIVQVFLLFWGAFMIVLPSYGAFHSPEENRTLLLLFAASCLIIWITVQFFLPRLIRIKPDYLSAFVRSCLPTAD